MSTVGFDFGTSYCVSSWINPRNGKIEPIKMHSCDGSEKYPSIITGTRTAPLFGKPAIDYLTFMNELSSDERQRALSSTIRGFKRQLKPEGKELIGGSLLSHAEILEMLFSEVIKDIQDHIGEDVIDTIIYSYPVGMEKSKLSMIDDALSRCRLNVISRIEEPIAAVRGYELEHEVNEGEGILVFDYGGGTTDVTFVYKKSGSFFYLPPIGNTTCGGQDLDILLYDFFRKQIIEKHQYDILNRNQYDISILNICVFLKEQVCRTQKEQSVKSRILINDFPVEYNFNLSYDTFLRICEAKIFEAISLAKEMISQITSNKKNLSRILLIGGSSQIPLVKLELEKLSNVPVITCGEKDIAVAIGCLADCLENRNIPMHQHKEKEKHNGPESVSPGQNDGILIFW